MVSRFATQPVATARLLLPDIRPYTLVMRIQPLDASNLPQQKIDVAINGRTLGALTLTWNPERIGDYRLDVPAALVRPGLNELAFRSERMMLVRDGREPFPTTASDRPVAFRLWYVTIVPR